MHNFVGKHIAFRGTWKSQMGLFAQGESAKKLSAQWWVCRHFCLFPLCVADVHNSPPNLCDGEWYKASLTKRLTSLTMTQVFRMFHKSRDHFTNDCVLCTDSIQSIKDTLMTEWGRLGLVTVCVHCCSIFWWGIKHNKPCLAFSSYPISQKERKKHLSKDSYLFEGVFVISVPPLLGWF